MGTGDMWNKVKVNRQMVMWTEEGEFRVGKVRDSRSGATLEWTDDIIVERWEPKAMEVDAERRWNMQG